MYVFLINFPYLVRTVKKFKRYEAIRLLSAFLSNNPPLNLTPESVEGAEIIIMGSPVIAKSSWDAKKAIELSSRKQLIPSFISKSLKNDIERVEIAKVALPYDISVIVSIYRPEFLFDSFLGNIKEQSIFERAEVVLVLVSPLKSEMEQAHKFAAENTNVILKLIDSRITIYDAWNLAINSSTAPLITNMNIDDLRSADSLEAQVAFMKSHSWVDVGYQDFYFLLDRDLDWISVVNVGAKSQLPAVTLTELAWFGVNPPHNGPVWKRDLHTRVGLFDETLRSAGDYEFWMRVASSGGLFAKMSKSTVGYYMNPEGMSTSVESPSTNEERATQEKYRAKIILSSEKLPGVKLDPSYVNHPWDGSELFTEMVLDKLKDVR